MTLLPNPMNALRSLQKELRRGIKLTPCKLDANYKMIYDEPNGEKRFSYTKIFADEIQALSIFVIAEPINNIPCFNIGYAVKENRRGSGLGVEAVEKGIEELQNGFRPTPVQKFYLEAIVDVTNKPSIKVAESLFPAPGKEILDHYTGKPALHFQKLVVIS